MYLLIQYDYCQMSILSRVKFKINIIFRGGGQISIDPFQYATVTNKYIIFVFMKLF